MMQDIWKLFPRLLEQKLNTLLDDAEPNHVKSFQLYKSCQQELLWSDSYDNFKLCLSHYFSVPKEERNKSTIDFYLNKPMHKSVYDLFSLDFRTANVCPSKLFRLSSWTHNVMRVNLKSSSSQIISIDTIHRTYNNLTKPTIHDKAFDLEFEDFCGAWRSTVFSLFGRKYDDEMKSILIELKRLEHELHIKDKTQRFIPSIYLTQTEIDWACTVRACVEEYQAAPKFPLNRGPQKEKLVELEKTVRLYNLVTESFNPEIFSKREVVRQTILHHCHELLFDKGSAITPIVDIRPKPLKKSA